MTDNQFSQLFAEGTAPERDSAFGLRVAAGIGQARLRVRLLALALRATGVLILSGAIFMAGRLIKPALVQLVDGSSQFMGVPLPVMLGVLVAGLVLQARRYLRRTT